MRLLSISKKILPYSICVLFFIAYATLGIIRHNHYESYGFDLGITDQIVWEYSHFKAPITTAHFYPYTSILTVHVEFIFALLSIFYWVWSSPSMLILVQSAALCFAGLPLYFLARDKKLKPIITYALFLSFLVFYGTQNALWFDVHSAVFGASFLAWFIYFLDQKRYYLSTTFFILTIICKENMPLLTLLVSLVYLIQRKSKYELLYVVLSAFYLFLIFGVYFPHFTKLGYESQSSQGLISTLNPLYLFNTTEKDQVFLVSLGWFGLLPLLSPLTLLPFLGDLASYFVIGSNLQETSGLFMHYRVTTGVLLTWSTILTIANFKFLNKWYVGIYLLILLLYFQYSLHLPLSYLTKRWFWEQSAAVNNINALLPDLPQNAAIVSQNNITPHLTQRSEIFTLWPSVKKFEKDSPCGHTTCNWLEWRSGKPQLMIVDTSTDWDIRHFLTSRDNFIDALQNMEKNGEITKKEQIGNAILYKINY